MRAIGVSELINRKFDVFEFDGPWKSSFGYPEKNFSAIVYGASGNGKTDFCIKFAKYLTQFGRVYYNSFEEGISKTLQDAVIRNKLEEVAGKIVFGNRETFKEMMARLKKRNSPKIVFVDSRDFINLTTAQYKQMRKAFPKKAFIIVCWESNGKPKSEHGKAIEYMVDIKIRVANFKARPRCRFGGNQDFIIWNRPRRELGGLFNQ